MSVNVRKLWIEKPSNEELLASLQDLVDENHLSKEDPLTDLLDVERVKNAIGQYGQFPEDRYLLQVAMQERFELFGWLMCHWFVELGSLEPPFVDDVMNQLRENV